MASDMRKYHYNDDDDDDWGDLPRGKLPRQRSSPINQIWRYRTHIFATTFFLALIYWMAGRRHRQTPTDSRFAYVQIVTDVHSMCNAYMIFEALHKFGSKADRVLLYPQEWNEEINDQLDRSSELLVRARKYYNVDARPTQLLGLDGAVGPGTLTKPSSWETSITKLRVFEIEDYDRVIYFDNDVLLLQHLDELFTLPSAPMAMARQYWADVGDLPLSSTLMVVEPNAAETKRLWDRLQDWRLSPDRAGCTTYDDDLIDDRFRSSALVLPHRPYLLKTSEFRRKLHEHEAYLGTHNGPDNVVHWDAHAEVAKAKLVHFDDWPLPKPWIMWPTAGMAEVQPDCGGGLESCADRDVWKDLYNRFRQTRKDSCRILSVPAPQDWRAYKSKIGASY